MRKSLFILLFIISCSLFAQEGHKVNADIDFSFGIHYGHDSELNNPIAAGGSIGYEYDFNMFLGVEAGIRGGGFNQKVGFSDGPNIGQDGLKSTIGMEGTPETIYKGSYWAPYIAPKIYFPIGYDDKKDRGRFIFLENRFSYTRTNLNMDKVTNMNGSIHKYRLTYELRGGYQFPVDDRWALSCWIGYNSFDFSKVSPKTIKHKNSTPLQIGIGFNYIIKE
ncbi:MAG: hypothetical protein LBV43_15710 [Prevotella sp.]|jgi:hypothetical protein|nr:hypothetical protein [Prevotella sp.]